MFSVTCNDGMTLRFFDALKCLVKSLDELVKITTRDKLRETSKYFAGSRLDLLTKKGIYPYDYMVSIENIKGTSLPPIRNFTLDLIKQTSVMRNMNTLNKVGILLKVKQCKIILYFTTNVMF